VASAQDDDLGKTTRSIRHIEIGGVGGDAADMNGRKGIMRVFAVIHSKNGGRRDVLNPKKHGRREEVHAGACIIQHRDSNTREQLQGKMGKQRSEWQRHGVEEGRGDNSGFEGMDDLRNEGTGIRGRAKPGFLSWRWN